MVIKTFKLKDMKSKIITYLSSKIKNIEKENVNVIKNESFDYIKFIDQTKSKIDIAIYIIENDKRIVCCLDDIEEVEIVDEYDADVGKIIQYLDFIITHEIIKYEVYCKEKLVSRYYEFHQKINGKEEKVKLFSMNKFSFFCKKEIKVTRYIPW